MSTPDLERFLQHPAFSPIDRHFGRHVAGLAAPASRLCGHAAALASLALQRGHICLPLDQPPPAAGDDTPVLDPWPELDDWLMDLAAAGIVATGDDEFRPLVLDRSGRLYLHRYFDYERALATAVLDRVRSPHPRARLPNPGLLDRLFPARPGVPDGPARRAAIVALHSTFMVLAGAPGTGKTTTILKILAVLLDAEPDLELALAAPTGKAANRMEESILAGLAALEAPAAIRDRIPRKASTIHRLLGSREDSAFFRHHSTNPLAADVVVIDEASMVDLPLMAKLFDALRPESRVILVGDPDQLASVEAGSVLSDVVRAARRRSSQEGADLVRHVITLEHNYRFSPESGIFPLCQAICHGDSAAALDLLHEERLPDIRLAPPPTPARLKDLLGDSAVLREYRGALTADGPVGMLEAWSHGRILCAVRNGPAGVTAVNDAVAALLHDEGLIGARQRFYHRRPVIVTRNDYAARLFNGDIGVILEDAHDRRLYAHFPGEQNTTRAVPALRLPDHESAFAMTIHRSQGSEFDHVLIILPPGPSPILSRELLYTAVSRARKSVTIWAEPEAIQFACAREVRRASGLTDRLLAGLER